MPINKKSIGKTFFLMRADTPNSKGDTYTFASLIEMCNTDPHLEMLGDELWYREQAIPKRTDERGIMKVVLPFDSFSTCFKCGYAHIFKQPKTKYNEKLDILEKSCINCEYTWWEQCHPIREKGK